MTDQQLRELVRQSVARSLGRARTSGRTDGPPPSTVAARVLAHGTSGVASTEGHPSHHQYVVVNLGDACVIEPSQACDHCGYCKSHGH